MPVSLNVLCYVVHFYGKDSEFSGGSTLSEASMRRDHVLRSIAALKALPGNITVQVAGLPEAALIPVNIDLSSTVSDPRHLVYATIEKMAEERNAYDVFIVIEDDVELPAASFARMLRFTQASSINEILMPNRVEISAEGEQYYPDIQAGAFFWSSLHRTFEGLDIGVFSNPHSGVTLLTQEQLRYAIDRVDLTRREEFHGGYMASAFANLHSPFLAWRTRDLGAHTAIHLDEWRYRPLPEPRIAPLYPQLDTKNEFLAPEKRDSLASRLAKKFSTFIKDGKAKIHS